MWAGERQREREGDTESKAGSRLWAVSTERTTGLEPTNREIMTWAEIRRSTKWATQVSANISFLILAQILIPESWDQTPFGVCLRFFLSLPLPLSSVLSHFLSNRKKKKKRKMGCLDGSIGWVSDFGSGHDLTVCGFKPQVGLYWQLRDWKIGRASCRERVFRNV